MWWFSVLKETSGVEVIKTVLLGSEGFFEAAARRFDISPASLLLWRDGMDWCVGLGGWGFFFNYQCIESSAFVVQSLVHLRSCYIFLLAARRHQCTAVAKH